MNQIHPPPTSPREDELVELSIGAGRSGVVFREQDASGRAIARKVFDSGRLTKFVQYLFLGAPNPYSWDQNAVQCALLRRRILAPLVHHWFGDKLRVAEAYGCDWNPRFRTFQLDSEYVRGAPPMLHHPMNRRGAREIDDLVHYVMAPLQDLLEEAGFDGLVWQAGRGNPVAMANFLRERGTDRFSRWAWIDLESGVPALFPLNPLTLVRYYLPRSLRLRRPLFDDVDCQRLRAYLDGNDSALRSSIGDEALVALRRDVDELEFHQREWKNKPRYQRSIRYQVAKGRIREEDARRYLDRPLRWYWREAQRVPPRTLSLVGRGLRKIGRGFARVPWLAIAAATMRFLFSSQYRWQIAQRFVGARIDSWERREQLLKSEADRLRAQLGAQESCAYLTDFGVHLAIKPFVKTVEYVVFGAVLYGSGTIDETTLAVAVLLGGCFARTAYTGMRFVQAALRRHELPWVALVTGAIPIIGNLAYPLQIVYSSTDEDDFLAQFILYDGCSAIGRRAPIWGGYDTLTEHAFNHIPDHIVRGRKG